MMSKARILGIDAGTSAMKAVLYDEEGIPVSSGMQEYNLITPSTEIVETKPDIYWGSLRSVLKQISSKLNEKNVKINALAISSQGESFITIDKGGRCLRNTIVWLDSRSKKEAKLIENEFGADNIYYNTGSPEVNTTWASTKLLWMRENEPDLFKRIYKILFIEDYLIYRLTGKFVANGALYCSSLLYCIVNNNWWDSMLDFIGISKSQLPDLYQSGVKVGEITKSAAKGLGVNEGIIVVSGGMDQACGCIGTRNIAPGTITENTGTSLNISATTDKPVFDSKRRVPCQTHAIKGKYMYLPWCKTAGIVFKWFRDNFCEEQIKKAKQEGKDSYDLLTNSAVNIPPGSDGVIMLPHLTGAMCPEMDENAKGIFYGLSLSTKRGHLIRSILESTSYMLRSNIELIEEAGIEVKSIITSGGTSNSDLWNQIKSDVLNKPIRTIKDKNSCCLGAAILAGVGSGIYNSIEKACDSIIEFDKEYKPINENKIVYGKYYNIYKELYSSLKSVFLKSAKLREI